MAKITFHDFGAIHDALNKMIIAEVKAALELLPDKKMEADGPVSLCRIVVSPDCDYSPRDLGVRKVWVDGPGVLHMKGFEGDEKILMSEYTELDDLLDITDFKYLIEQIAEEIPGNDDHVLISKTITICGYEPELALKNETRKQITI